MIGLVVKRGRSRSWVRINVPQPGWVLELSSEPGCLAVAGDVGFASSLQKEEKCVSLKWAWVGMGKSRDFCPPTIFSATKTLGTCQGEAISQEPLCFRFHGALDT